MADKTLRPFLLVTTVIMLLTGCKDARWGQSFKDFAGGQAGPLSRRYADADLSVRWERLYRDSLPLLKMEFDVAQIALEGIKISPLPVDPSASDATRQERVQLSADFLLLLNLLSKNESAQLYLQSLHSLCTDKNAFLAFGLNNHVIHQTMKHMIPSIEETTLYSVSINPIESAVSLGSAIFSKRNHEKQQKLFDEGKILLQEQLIGDDEMFSLSSKRCQEIQAPYNSVYNQIMLLFREQRQQINYLMESISVRSQLVDSVLIARDIELMIESLGLGPMLRDLEQSLEEYQIGNFLDQVFAHLQEMRTINTSSPLSLDTLMKIEESLDLAQGFVTQIELMMPKIANKTLRRRMEQQLRFLKEAKDLLIQFYPEGK